MTKKVGTTAQVKLTVSVQSTSTWGVDCKIDQVFSQAGLEAKNRLRDLLSGSGIKIIGEPEVAAVMTEKDW